MVRKQKVAEAVPAAPPSPRRTRAAAAANPPPPVNPPAQDPDTELDEVSGEGDNEEDIAPSPAKKTRSRAKKQAAKKSGKKAATGEVAGENVPKHARNAARGRKSQVFVELPATPTAHRARVQDSISGSGLVDREMPPSSPPPAPPSSTTERQSPASRRVPQSSPGPQPLFPPELVRRARERAQRMLAQADAQIEATRGAQGHAHREEAPQDADFTMDEEDGANSGSDYEAGIAERDARDARKAKRGEKVVRTEDEDEEDEREFEAEATTPRRTYAGQRSMAKARHEQSLTDEDETPKAKREHAAQGGRPAGASPTAPRDDGSGPAPVQKRQGGFSKSAQSRESRRAPGVAPSSDLEARSARVAQELFGAEESPTDVVNGKQREMPDNEDEEEAVEQEEDDEDEEDDEQDWPRTRGAFSKVGKEEAQQIGRDFNKMVDDLARKHGKSRKVVLKHTGVTLQATRAANSFCKYSIWYANKHPITSEHDPTSYAAEIRSAYHELVDGLGKKARAEALRPVLEWVAELEAGNVDGGESRKAASSMMKAAHEQLEALCRVYATHGVVICGAILSTTPDPAARQMSKIFGTAPELLDFVAANEITVWRYLDWFQNCIVCQRYSMDGIKLPLPADFKSKPAVGKGKEKEKAKDQGIGPSEGKDAKDKKRDALRVSVKSELVRQLRAFIPEQASMTWTGWANLAWEHGLLMDKWPVDLAAPGPNFNWKGFTTKDLERLLAALREADDSKGLRIVEWSSADIKLAEAMDVKVADVGVVIDTTGRVLRTVRESTNYLKAKAKASKRKAIVVDSDGDDDAPVVESSRGEEPRRQVAPLPRRINATDGNPAPRKRKRLEEVPAETGSRRPAEMESRRPVERPQARPTAYKVRSIGRARVLGPPPDEVFHFTQRSAMENAHHAPAIAPMRPMPTELIGPGVRHDQRIRDEDEVIGFSGPDDDYEPRMRIRRPTTTRQDMQRMERFAEDFMRYDSPLPRAPIRRYASLAPTDSDGDLPAGPAAMVGESGFHDGRGHYFVAQQGPARPSAGDRAQALRQAPRGRVRSSGESSRSVASSRPTPSSSVAGSSRQSEGSSRMHMDYHEVAPRGNYNPHGRYQRRNTIYEEDVDDDMHLAPRIPEMRGYDPADYEYGPR
ncbi:hypothetical protein PLICRDRAFT_177305 [Plicaturopsis crispa FD-325 SS-3]|nr:hypothetical protein PLICRDRAFT_177305 [Plicaturopsis crispa FD-325 SS-3]